MSADFKGSQVDAELGARLHNMAEIAWDAMMSEDGTRGGEIKAIFNALVRAHAIGIQDATRGFISALRAREKME